MLRVLLGSVPGTTGGKGEKGQTGWQTRLSHPDSTHQSSEKDLVEWPAWSR